MKAIALQQPGQPAALVNIPTPSLGEEDVLVRVHAASVNGFDVYQASGALLGIMEHALPAVVGRDFAGVVEATGGRGAAFRIGDRVLGFVPSTPPLKGGSFAEHVAGGPGLVLARMPDGIGFDEAAALPLAGTAALDLLEAIDATAPDVVLIVGATGGVGSLAVQLAARRGLTVIATARPEEDAFVRELGASETVDYTAGDLATAVHNRFPDGIAAVIDVVNRQDSIDGITSVVRPGGHVASLLGAADTDALAGRRITGHNVMAAPTPAKLAALGKRAASGELQVPVQATYPLERVAEAFAAFQQGTRGKIVLHIN